MIVHTDCLHYKGDLPCKPHKSEGVHCEDCKHFLRREQRILIIKLGAIGDVIRTTPLLRKLAEVYPNAQFHWLTLTPAVVPSSVHRIYPYDLKSLEIIKQTPFDILFNLDKDREACALANVVQAQKKYGFLLVEGDCAPTDKPSEDKWITGLFDDENQKNQKSYPQEIFEICGFEFNKEEYILELQQTREWDIPRDKPIVGLNTGCGLRWTTRLWPEEYWIETAKVLKENGYTVIFLGGEQEHEKNTRMAKASDALYLGHFSLNTFLDLMNQCDVIVTAVTMALHFALGLKKKIVLFVNIFNRHEFEMYDRGIILEPPKDCKGCFMNDCPETCMELIKPTEVVQAISEL